MQNPVSARTMPISFRRMALLVLVYLVITFAVPHPQSIRPAEWRFFATFIVTVLGLMIEPIPGGAMVLLGVTLAAVFRDMTISQVLSGYSDPVVWLVLTSNFIALALIKTG